jgi:glutamyl-tRNA synthetase
MEDTDRERSTPESVKAILDGLRWLGLDWDEGPEVGGPYGPYFQTERLASYRKYAEQLISEGHAYRCYCTKENLEQRKAAFIASGRKSEEWKYDGHCRNLSKPVSDPNHVVRFKMPQRAESLSFEDRVIGKISKTYDDLDDFVMLRADGIPLYNFGCVIDDHEMEISLVGRGQEHINSTFPQLALYQALKWAPPAFAHLPLILGVDREKLSKRKHPEADVMLHRRNGVLPEALLNFVVRLGWGHGDDEFIPVEQMKQLFDFANVGKTSGVWNPDKLTWLNQQYLKKLPPEDIARRVAPFLAHPIAPDDGRLQKLVVAFRERSKSLVEMAEKMRGYFSHGITLDAAAAEKHLNSDGKAALQKAHDALQPLDAWTASSIDAALKALAESTGIKLGSIAQPLRVAVTGGTQSPGIGETLELLGRQEALERISVALK